MKMVQRESHLYEQDVEVRVGKDESDPSANTISHHYNGTQSDSEEENLSVDEKRWKRAAAAALSGLKGGAASICSVQSTVLLEDDSTKGNFKDAQEDLAPTKKAETKQRRGLARLRKKQVQPKQEIQKDAESLEPELALPQFVFQHKISTDDGTMRDFKGYAVLQVLPAMIDRRHGAETYTSVICMYLDQVLNDAETELDKDGNKIPPKFTLLLDVRPGRGWPNPQAGELVGFIREVAHELCARYPDNLSQCFLFPIPRAAVCLWYAIRPFLDHKLRTCMHLVSGVHGVTITSPPPHDKMVEFMSIQDLEMLEKYRLSCYC